MQNNIKVDILAFLAFRQEYFKVKSDERFGQAFLNKFLPDVKDSKLFYETDVDSVETMILNRYITGKSNG